MSTVQQSFEFFVDVPRRKMTIQEHFEAFHAANPWIYRELVRMARDLKARGYSKWSVDALLHFIRFNRARNIDRGGDTFAVNNNFSSRYSSLIMQREEDLQGFFETRQRRAA